MVEEELADSGSEIDMDAAMESISKDVFGVEPEQADEEVVETPEEETPEPEAAAPQEEEEKEVRAAPQSWKKEMHEFWNGLDPAVQNYVEQREEQMREGLEKDRGDANLGRDMRDIMSPYAQILRDQNVDQRHLIKNLMNAHYRLTTADDAEKPDLLRQLAESYGLPVDGQIPQIDPVLKAVQDKVRYLEHNINESQQRTRQEAHDRVNRDVEAFALDPEHEFFDEVAEQIVPLINSGYTLEDAYENAIWLNPVTRQKELDRLAKESSEQTLEEAKQEAEKKRKAKSANVRGRDTNKAPTEQLGTMEDTMREVYRDIQSRSH